MSTTYYVACRKCVEARPEEVVREIEANRADPSLHQPHREGAPHIHQSDDWDDNPDGRGIAHSSGWWRMNPENLNQDLVLMNEYGDLMTVSDARERIKR